MPDSHLGGYSQVVAASILFGLIGIFIRLLGSMPLGSIIFYRLLFGLAAVSLYLACRGKFGEIRLKEKRKYLLLLGLFEAVSVVSYFYSVRHTNVSIAVLLLYTAPVYVTVLSPLVLKENITRRSLFALALSIAGVVVVIQPHENMESTGIIGLIMGLVSGVFYAFMILTSRYLRDCYTGTAQTMWSIIVTMIAFVPYSWNVPASLLLDNLHLLILFGLIPTAMASVLYLNGLRFVRAQNASIIALLEPVSAVFFAFIILNEPLSSTTLLGGGLILLSAVIISRERS